MGRGRQGIVFVHGIVGNNHIFDFLRPLVPECLDTRYVVLKGHGGDALAFSRASMSQWNAQVEDAVSDLADRCEKVIGIGHSMGCLLLMNQAVRDRLAGLFLMNPPMCIKPRLSLLGNVVRVATGHIQHSPVAKAAKEAYGISLDFNPLHYYGWLRRYLELFLEIGKVRRKVIPAIGCPVRVMLSAKDELVSISSENVLKRLRQVEITILPESSHYYYPAVDREIIRSSFTEMLSCRDGDSRR